MIEDHFGALRAQIEAVTAWHRRLAGMLAGLVWIERLFHAASATAMVFSIRSAIAAREEALALAAGTLLRAAAPIALSALPSLAGWLFGPIGRSLIARRVLHVE